MYKEIKNKIEKYKEDKLERDIAKAKEKSERRRIKEEYKRMREEEKRQEEEMRIEEERRKIEEKKQRLLALSEKELLVELYLKMERIENNYNEIMDRVDGLDCDVENLRYNSFNDNDY